MGTEIQLDYLRNKMVQHKSMRPQNQNFVFDIMKDLDITIFEYQVLHDKIKKDNSDDILFEGYVKIKQLQDRKNKLEIDNLELENHQLRYKWKYGILGFVGGVITALLPILIQYLCK